MAAMDDEVETSPASYDMGNTPVLSVAYHTTYVKDVPAKISAALSLRKRHKIV